jgi:hypothetical protein
MLTTKFKAKHHERQPTKCVCFFTRRSANVIEQAIGELSSHGYTFEGYYFRTSDQYELDLVLDLGPERWAVEVKLTALSSVFENCRHKHLPIAGREVLTLEEVWRVGSAALDSDDEEAIPREVICYNIERDS